MSYLDNIQQIINNLERTINTVISSAPDAVAGLNKIGQAAASALANLSNSVTDGEKIVFGLNQQNTIYDAILTKQSTYVKNTLTLENINKSITKTFGVSVQQAAEMSQQFAEIGKLNGLTHKTTIAMGEAIKKNVVAFAKEVEYRGEASLANNEYYVGLIASQKILTRNLKLTEDQAAQIQGWAAQTGKDTTVQLYNTEMLTKALQTQTGLTVSTKEIYEEIAEAGEEIQMQFGRMPGRLELAAVKAKSLGLSLAEMKQTGENLLNIESSIGQELEYQLLSGRRLVDQVSGKSLTNTIREATLRGDMSAQADAMYKILEQEGDVLQNNLFARKQMADLLQMDEAALSRAMQKKKLLEGAGAEVLFNLQGDELAKAASAMVSSGKLTEAQYDTLMKLSTDTRGTEELMEEQNAIAKDQRAMEILQYRQAQIITDILTQSLGQNAKLNQGMLGMSEAMLKGIGTEIAEVKKVKMFTDAYTDVTTTGIGDLGNAPATNDPEVDNVVYDAIIPPGLGGVISLPAGTVGFQKNDGIAISTNNPLEPAASNNSNDMMAFAAAIVNAINSQTQQLKRDGLFGPAAGNQPLYG